MTEIPRAIAPLHRLQSIAHSAPCKQSRVLLRFKLFATIELQYSAVTGLTEMSAFQRESRFGARLLCEVSVRCP